MYSYVPITRLRNSLTNKYTCITIIIQAIGSCSLQKNFSCSYSSVYFLIPQIILLLLKFYINGIPFCFMVGRVRMPQRCPYFNLHIKSLYFILHNERDFADMITLRALRRGSLTCILQVSKI